MPGTLRGRETELAIIAERLAATAAGRGGTIVIEGRGAPARPGCSPREPSSRDATVFE